MVRSNQKADFAIPHVVAFAVCLVTSACASPSVVAPSDHVLRGGARLLNKGYPTTPRLTRRKSKCFADRWTPAR